jgi:hypothetical protein
MTTLQRRRIHWAGFQGGPGVNTFFLQEGAAANTALRAFYNALTAYIPTTVVISFDQSGDEVDEASGALTGTWSDVAASAVTGLGSGAYGGASGAVVEWLTASVATHRRIVGKTFLVPLVNAAYDTSGTLASAFITTCTTAANTLVAALVAPNQLGVWHRPVGGAGGRLAPVTGTRVPDLAAVLRSRRD